MYLFIYMMVLATALPTVHTKGLFDPETLLSAACRNDPM